MAKLQSFRIQNFKGIGDATIKIEDGGPYGRYVTLIGLNESGKTTILEALSYSSLGDIETANLMVNVTGPLEINNIIPKRHAADFTGDVTITATIELDNDEISKIQDYIKSEFGFSVVKGISPIFTIRKIYSFVNSDLKKEQNLWSFMPLIRKKSGKKDIQFSTQNTDKEWRATSNLIKDMLPSVSYFSTFLINFPRRIYLEGEHGEADKYYRGVLDDLLSGLPGSMSVEQHILARAKVHREKPHFGTALRASPQAQQIDAVVQRITEELNRVIFGAWNTIFGKTDSNKRFNIEWHIDEGSTKQLYLEIYIVANGNRYYISERSLGFRWFFAFLLFTQFRTNRDASRRLIMLFDEPASHLHARAQQRLLQSFEKIAEPNNIIIYSTHSHYLINPMWLEKAYIVINESADEQDDFGLDSLDIDPVIKVQKYRNYVKDNPGRTTYFQPALDALDYGMPSLSFESPVVILEGKYDYYPFKALSDGAEPNNAYRVLPAVGADGMLGLISIMRGWGIRFLVLLDDDNAGRKAKTRYQKQFLLSDSEIATVADLDPTLVGLAFEGVFKKDVTAAMNKHGMTSSSMPQKGEYYLFFQKIVNKDLKLTDIEETIESFKRIHSGILARLAI